MFGTGSGLAAFGGFLTLFLLLIGILWLLVPFAVFGIKPLLGKILAEQRRTNEILTRLSQQIHPIALKVTERPEVPATSTPAPQPPSPEPPADTRTLGEIMSGKPAP